jgi:hypothetical protein
MKIKVHFDTNVNHHHYYTDWTTIIYNKVKQKNPGLTLQKALEKLLDKLQLCQRALGTDYTGKDALRTNVIRACRSKQFAKKLERRSLTHRA